jgi:hypothetical protein
MKRKLAKRNKAQFSLLFRQKVHSKSQPLFDTSEITFASIAAFKQKGQLYYQQRLARLQKMNKRQRKKFRKKQQLSGHLGSKFGYICKTPLKPASAILIKKP